MVTANKYAPTSAAQPFNLTVVTNYTSLTNNDTNMYVGDICCGNGIGIDLDVALSNIRQFFSNAVIFTGFSTNTWYAEQSTWNGVAGISNVNGSTQSALASGTDGDGNGFIYVLSDSGGNGCGCSFLEGGVWQAAFNSIQQANQTANQRSATYGWGF